VSPLYDTVDRLLAHMLGNPPAPKAQVETVSTYEGYQITLMQDGTAEFVKVT